VTKGKADPETPPAAWTAEEKEALRRLGSLFRGLAPLPGTAYEENLAAEMEALTLVLATGQRLGEVLEMEPGDLELMDSVWIIPGAKAKNGHTHSVPLTDWALALVGETRQLHPDSDRVFPVSADTVRTYMRQTIQAAKLKRATPHDLRRTVATHLGGLGHSRQVQDKILNHVDQTVGGIYDQHTYDPEKRAALEDWAAEFERITSEGAV